MVRIATRLAIIVPSSLAQAQTPNPLDHSQQGFRPGERIEQLTVLDGKRDNGIWKWASDEFLSMYSFPAFLTGCLAHALVVGAPNWFSKIAS
jgi:hypothetical protein